MTASPLACASEGGGELPFAAKPGGGLETASPLAVAAILLAAALLPQAAFGTGADDALSLASGRAEAVYGGRLSFESGGSVVLRSSSAEYSSGFRLLPPPGKTAFDLSAGRYLAADVENRGQKLRCGLIRPLGERFHQAYEVFCFRALKNLVVEISLKRLI